VSSGSIPRQIVARRLRRPGADALPATGPVLHSSDAASTSRVGNPQGYISFLIAWTLAPADLDRELNTSIAACGAIGEALLAAEVQGDTAIARPPPTPSADRSTGPLEFPRSSLEVCAAGLGERPWTRRSPAHPGEGAGLRAAMASSRAWSGRIRDGRGELPLAIGEQQGRLIGRARAGHRAERELGRAGWRGTLPLPPEAAGSHCPEGTPYVHSWQRGLAMSHL
jgi:hypothetical protein